MSSHNQPAQRHNDHSTPSDDAIEAIIHHATSSRQERPLKDTRTQLYVGNLPYRVRWQDLKDLFRKAGTVLRADVSLGLDNRSKGHGTVVLATAEDAGRAVDMFNGFTWQTRVLEVRLDRLMPDYELGGTTAIGTAKNAPSTSVGPGGGAGIPVMTTGATGNVPYPLPLGLGIGGSASGATSAYVGMSGRLAALGSTSGAGPSTNLSLPSVPNTAANSTSPLATSFSSRPSSSSAPSHDPLDYLHSSGSAPSALNFQTPDLQNANRTLFVGNLPFHIQWQDLKDLFRKAGTILRADVVLGPDNRSRGFGTVVFATDADADRALAMFNGYEHLGRVLKVHYDKFSSLQPPSSNTFSTSSAWVPASFPAATASHGLSIQQQQHPASGSTSLHSSTPSTAAHSNASSPRSAHAHAQLSSSLPSHLQTNTHALIRSGCLPQASSTLQHRPSQVQLRSHMHVQPTVQHPGHITLPHGFHYDYGPSSEPSSPYEMMQQQQRQLDYFERIHRSPQHQQQLGYERQLQQWEKEQQLDEQLRERDAQWELERLGLHHQQLLQQRREREHEERSREKRFNLQQHHEGLINSAPNLTSVSTPTLDIESLTSSLVSMKIPSSSASASMTGLPYRYGHGQAQETSFSPPSVSVSNSISTSASTSASVSAPSPTSTTSNSNSNPQSTSSSKPSSTKPVMSALKSAMQLLPPSVSSSSLPLHLGSLDRIMGPGSRKASSSIGVATGGYDKAYESVDELYPPLMSAQTSTSSGSFMTTQSGSSSVGGGDESMTQASSPFIDPHYMQGVGKGKEKEIDAGSDMVLESGQTSPSNRGFVSGSGRASRSGDREDEEVVKGTAPSSGTSNQGGQHQQQRQIPYHPGPISIPPPLPFNPMQMQMGMMPLTTMTPGHAQMHTPHATVAAMVGMTTNPNVSPLYHPAHAAAVMASMAAAAAARGGGSPSPFGVYPGPPALAGAGMIPFTPHGLPPITPSMPPFTFLPQYYMHAGASGGEEERVKGGSKMEGCSRNDEGNSVGSAPEGGLGSSTPQDLPRQQQQQQQQQQQPSHPLRLNLASAIPGTAGFSPGVTMSPGAFYGRPGEIPGPNPFINTAVGAPVHPVMHSPVQHHPAYYHHHHHHHQPPHHHAHGYDAGAGPSHGGYIPSPWKVALPGAEPQGYFDPIYFPGGTGYAGVSAAAAKAESGGEGTEVEVKDKVNPLATTAADDDEVMSPQDDLESFKSFGDACGSDDQPREGNDDEEDQDDISELDVVVAVPLRTRSDGYTHQSSLLPREKNRKKGVVATHRSESDPVRSGNE